MTIDELLTAVQDDRGWPTRDGGYRDLDTFTVDEASRLLRWIRGQADQLYRRAAPRLPRTRRVGPRAWLAEQPLPARLAVIAGETLPSPAQPPTTAAVPGERQPRTPREQAALDLLTTYLGAKECTS